MGTLHLDGTLKLQGPLVLGDKVMVAGNEALVALQPLQEKCHASKGAESKQQPPPPDLFLMTVWVTDSEKTTVSIGGKAVVVDGEECVQSSARRMGSVKAGKCAVTVDGVAVAVLGIATATIENEPVVLTSSGQTAP